MKATHRLIATVVLAVAGAGAAFAQEATPDTWAQVAASKSRAQVQAELQQARKDGSIKSWSAGYIEPLRSVKSRDQVRAEFNAARASGELEAINGEVYGYTPVPAAVYAKKAGAGSVR